MASEAPGIDAAPAAGQTIFHSGTRFTTIQEGRAFILVPETAKEAAEQKDPRNKDGPVQSVFYNPIQQFNRDLTVLAIKAYGEETVERRKKAIEAKIKRNVEKKRKRQEPKAEDVSEKAAKTHDAASPQESKGATQAMSPEVVEAIGEVKYAIEQAASNGTPAQQQSDAEDVQMQDASAEGQSTQSKQLTTEGLGQDSVQIKAPFTILDALSATGLRALRYAQEMPFVTKVTANDLDPSAVESIKRNISHNKLEDKIEVTKGDALGHMYMKIVENMALTDKERSQGKSKKYDVLDLDPYGTAATFLDAAVQAVRDDGGLLCVTCTDAGVWASNGYPEKAFALYGGIPVKGSHSHEVGLRLILHSIATSAARYGLTIEPLLSLSIDFYARVFVKVKKSPAAVKFAAGKTMLMYNCDAGCGAWSTQLLLRNKSYQNKNASGTFYKHQMTQGPTVDQHCEHCGFKTHLAGPMYAGRLHSPDFVKRILDKLPEADKEVYGTTERIKGMLTTALEENMDDLKAEGTPKSKEDALAEIDPYPFFFLPTQLARTVHCATPAEDVFRGAIRGLGYRATRSHCKPGSIKTDAPWSVIWEIIREWIRQKAPIKEDNIKPGTPGFRILGLKVKEQSAESKNDGAGAENAKKDGEGEIKAEEKKLNIVFDEKLGKEKNKEKLVRYQMNPRENWGPMNRAKAP
ncbi:tRNA (guanine(26)-N(2))-dimethyltransferase [Cytospora mali]|uniref:tRNA (guanine(26)-N(2))-dimethyltransferase n=1 Tax=Cytospora mali TaxID=578113 RepID=A0A194UQ26_CYTMA|nr:tRNA (guanine(26)-N(2))-dimethyltransferase [Valsa mali var. pyri (nom. inval.)]